MAFTDNPIENILQFCDWALEEAKQVHERYSALSFFMRDPLVIDDVNYRFYPGVLGSIRIIQDILREMNDVNKPSSSDGYDNISSSDERVKSCLLMLTALNNSIAEKFFTYKITDEDEKNYLKDLFVRAYVLQRQLMHGNELSNFTRVCQHYITHPDEKLTEMAYRNLLRQAIETHDILCLKMLPQLHRQSYIALNNPLFLALQSGDNILFESLWNSIVQGPVENIALTTRILCEHLMTPGHMLVPDYQTGARAFYSVSALRVPAIPSHQREMIDIVLNRVVHTFLKAATEDVKQLFWFYNNIDLHIYLFEQGCMQTFATIMTYPKAISYMNEDSKKRLLPYLARQPGYLEILTSLYNLGELSFNYLFGKYKNPYGGYHSIMSYNDIVFDKLLQSAFERQDAALLDFLITRESMSFIRARCLLREAMDKNSHFAVTYLLALPSIQAQLLLFTDPADLLLLQAAHELQQSTILSTHISSCNAHEDMGQPSASRVLYPVISEIESMAQATSAISPPQTSMLRHTALYPDFTQASASSSSVSGPSCSSSSSSTQISVPELSISSPSPSAYISVSGTSFPSPWSSSRDADLTFFTPVSAASTRITPAALEAEQAKIAEQTRLAEEARLAAESEQARIAAVEQALTAIQIPDSLPTPAQPAPVLLGHNVAALQSGVGQSMPTSSASISVSSQEFLLG